MNGVRDRLVLGVWLVALVACSGGAGAPDAAVVDGRVGGVVDAPVDGATDAAADAAVDAGPPGPVCDQLDILFVLDDSGSMTEEQTALANAMTGFADDLLAFRTTAGAALDVRIGITASSRTFSVTFDLGGTMVTISEAGRDGALLQACDLAQPWVEEDTADLGMTLGCLTQAVGTAATVEMPWLATLAAVDEAVNPGFLRDDAMLLVVYLTDEDDCSVEGDSFTLGLEQNLCDGATYPLVTEAALAAGLDARKGARARWAMAAIAGQTTCMSTLGNATEAVRIKALTAGLGASASFFDICQADLVAPLAAVLAHAEAVCSAP